MEDLFGAIVVIIGIIASIISSAKKQKEKNAALEKHKAAAYARTEAGRQKQTVAMPTTEPQPQPATAAQPAAAAPAPVQIAAPTVHSHIEPDCVTHDQPGSLGVTSMEGKDPCHEDELTLNRSFAETSDEQGGLTLSWTGENMVKAFVMQEVLTRPASRMPVRQRQTR